MECSNVYKKSENLNRHEEGEHINKVIFIIIDGLSYNVGSDRMGYLMHLVEQNKASFYKVKSELPTLSRPLYEVLLTGTTCLENKITSNEVFRRSFEKSVFELAKDKGLTTAAAAYHWMSELYNSSPFNQINDREQKDTNKNIQYGKFYFEDFYPDSHLFIDGEILRRENDPDFLLIHSMGVDYAGHVYGGTSKEYNGSALRMDNILAAHLPLWMELGYKIVITSDHGMNTLGHHGGLDDSERFVPMWIINNKEEIKCETTFPQLYIAPMLCHMLGINPSEKMEKFTDLL